MSKTVQKPLRIIQLVFFLGLATFLLSCNSSSSKDEIEPVASEQLTGKQDSIIYRIVIDDEINPSVTRLVNKGIQEAKDLNAAYILLELETYGGLVVDADEIRTSLLNCPIPTIIYIQNNAASAGALISLACDSIYMNPSATIGAAAVVDQSGQVQA